MDRIVYRDIFQYQLSRGGRLSFYRIELKMSSIQNPKNNPTLPVRLLYVVQVRTASSALWQLRVTHVYSR